MALKEGKYDIVFIASLYHFLKKNERKELEKKILIVGTPVGKKADMFIVDTPSIEEVNDLIMSLPNHAKMNVDVIPLVDFRVQDTKIRQNLEHLKTTLK